MKVGEKKENSNNRTLLKGTQKAQKKRDYKHFPTCCPSFQKLGKKKFKGTEEEKYCLCATSQTNSNRKGSQT